MQRRVFLQRTKLDQWKGRVETGPRRAKESHFRAKRSAAL
jgi:hypothetical protein